MIITPEPNSSLLTTLFIKAIFIYERLKIEETKGNPWHEKTQLAWAVIDP